MKLILAHGYVFRDKDESLCKALWEVGESLNKKRTTISATTLATFLKAFFNDGFKAAIFRSVAECFCLAWFKVCTFKCNNLIKKTCQT